MFAAANKYRMAIAVHVRASVTQKLPYGREEALIFLNELMPAAPDLVVQVAHLAGAGSWQDEGAHQALQVFADAVATRDPRTRLLYVDVTALAAPSTPDNAQRWAATLRRLGAERVVFGSDAAVPNPSPGEAWATLRKVLPLTDDEYRAIAANVPPYMR